MHPDLILVNLLNPPVLFFFLGLIAVWLKSDLEVPQPLPKFFSLYLLLAIGFKGGVELRHNGLHAEALTALGAALALSVLVPLLAWPVLRRRLDNANAAAIAATYGSVSAVTFIAAISFLEQLQVAHGGYMVAALALMEFPAILVGVALYNRAQRGDQPAAADSWGKLLHEAVANGSVLLLVGSLVIGALTGESGGQALKPYTTDIFRGMLCLFLLDMGIVSGRRLGQLRTLGAFPVAFALGMPLAGAVLALGLAALLGLSAGDAFLLTVLAASASYIAVPAAMRNAIPEASPGVYVTLALAVTFPFNIVVGLPLYMASIRQFWS